MNRISFSTMSPFKKVTHVIFDLDGLLLDTETIYTKAVQNIVGAYGKTYDWSKKVEIMGLTGVEASKKIVELFQLPLTWEEYYALATEQYKILMPEAELMPDTENIYKRVIAHIAKRYGKTYTDKIRMKIIGTPQRETCRIAVTEMRLPTTVDEFQKKFHVMAEGQFVKKVPLMAGAEKFVRHLHSNKVPIAVATSSGLESYQRKASHHKEFFSLFHHVVTGGTDPDVKHGKPSPDIFLVCASRFIDKPKPEKCLVFEDAPNGVTAAVEAGMQVVMVPDKQITDEMCKHATLRLNSLEEMKPELFGLPKMQ